jgi:hypothetical protein
MAYAFDRCYRAGLRRDVSAHEQPNDFFPGGRSSSEPGWNAFALACPAAESGGCFGPCRGVLHELHVRQQLTELGRGMRLQATEDGAEVREGIDVVALAGTPEGVEHHHCPAAVIVP